MTLSINGQTIDIRYREQADGSLYVAYGDESHQLYAKEEPLGLRMVLDGVTVLLPTLYDPSELRSDVTGKLVRYTVEDGETVKAGEPFAEAEAMKMIIALKASEGGKVKHEKQPGSIINQGDLLASLELADPSKVKKILTFSGELSYQGGATREESTLQAFRSSQKGLELVMDGYVLESEELVSKMLAALSSVSLVIGEVNDAASMLGQKLPAELDAMLQRVYADTMAQHQDGADTKETAKLCDALTATIDEYVNSQLEAKREGLIATFAPITAVVDKFKAGLRENAIAVVCNLLSRFMAVESNFINAGSTDQAIAALVKANPDGLATVYQTAFAHEQLALRSGLCISLLRQLAAFPERFGVEPLRDLPPELDVVVTMSQLPSSSYKELALVAAKFGLMKAEKPFADAVEELRSELKANGADTAAVSRSVVTNALLELFGDADVGTTAMQVAIKRWYRTFDIEEMTTSDANGAKLIDFKYKAADKAQEGTEVTTRTGQMAYVADMSALSGMIDTLLDGFKGEGPAPINSLHIALSAPTADGAGAEEELITSATQLLATVKPKLEAKGIRLVSLTVPKPPGFPAIYSFRSRTASRRLPRAAT